MADDLIAELTFRLQNQTNAGLEEIKAEFGGLNGTLQSLNGVLSELSTALADMKAPAALQDGMAGVVGSANDAVTAVAAIGTALDADIGKVRELTAGFAAMDLPGFASGSGYNSGGVRELGGGYAPMPLPTGGAGAGDDVDVVPQAGGKGGKFGHALNDAFMGAIAEQISAETARAYADYDWIIAQTTIKEGLSGAAAKAEDSRLTDLLNSVALKDYSSSDELAQAYYFLITTGMKPSMADALIPSLAQDATAYGVPVMDDVKNLYTIGDVMGIPADQMPLALSTLSKATMLGHFGISDFDTYLPDFGGRLELLKDTGIGGEVQVAAALESTRKMAGTSEEDAIDLEDLLTYLSSPIASRFFDRTQRSKDLLGAPLLGLFHKYHIPDISIPGYLDAEQKAGKSSFDAMMDLSHLIFTEFPKGTTGTDELSVFTALFHNSLAAKAALAISENFDAFHNDETTLYGTDPNKVRKDFQTAIQTPDAQMNLYQEEFAQAGRTMGQILIPDMEALGKVAIYTADGFKKINDWIGSLGVGIGTVAAHLAYGQNEPNAVTGSRFSTMRIHVDVTHNGNATVTAHNVPPGVNVKVNQGNVLNAP